MKIPGGAFVGLGGAAIEPLVQLFVGGGGKCFCVASIRGIATEYKESTLVILFVNESLLKEFNLEKCAGQIVRVDFACAPMLTRYKVG